MKIAQPWFRKNRGWFITLHGRQIPLGKEKKAAFEEYKRVLSTPPAKAVRSDSVAVLIDKFLDWVKLHRAHRYLRLVPVPLGLVRSQVS